MHIALVSNGLSSIEEKDEIVPLPREISSWLISLLQRLPVTEQLWERHMRTRLGRGQGGKNTVDQLELSRMSYSTTLPGSNESESWEPLSSLSEKGDFQDHLMEPWLKAQSEVPFHMSHRPSGKMTGQTKQKTKTANLEELYLGSTEPTKTATQIQNNKRPPPFAFLLNFSKIKQQRPNDPRVSWQSEVSSMHADRASI